MVFTGSAHERKERPEEDPDLENVALFPSAEKERVCLRFVSPLFGRRSGATSPRSIRASDQEEDRGDLHARPKALDQEAAGIQKPSIRPHRVDRSAIVSFDRSLRCRARLTPEKTREEAIGSQRRGGLKVCSEWLSMYTTHTPKPIEN